MNILRSIKPAILAKNGFISSAVYCSSQEEDSILYIEKWRTREALHRHIRSPLYIRVLTVMDLSKKTPEISFCESEEGFDLVHELRK
jgi:quinol monooxygenase YgiN